MKISKDFEEFFALLNAHKVKYLVIGGYAFAVHVEPRYTKDLDILYKLSKENAQKLYDVLIDFGFQSLSVGIDDLTSPGKIIQIGNPPLRIDLLNEIDGITFDKAWNSKIVHSYGNEKINVIGKEALIKNKQASGREQDQLDIKKLRE
ncbi:MAG: nucleotidyltransferase [Balneolaceae bacterium]|nr:nucleotidyltransferase [Balneolaceae bacterium]